MGKTPEAKRLNVWVDPRWIDHPRFVELREKGHRVVVVSLPDDAPDLILSPIAHRFTEAMLEDTKYLDAALKTARSAKPKASKPKKGAPRDSSP